MNITSLPNGTVQLVDGDRVRFYTERGGFVHQVLDAGLPGQVLLPDGRPLQVHPGETLEDAVRRAWDEPADDWADMIERRFVMPALWLAALFIVGLLLREAHLAGLQ